MAKKNIQEQENRVKRRDRAATGRNREETRSKRGDAASAFAALC